jgi:diacylglycerol kinase family enzyme
VDEILLFANPIAGRGRGRAIAQRISARLKRDGYDVRAFHAKPESIATERLICAAPARAAIAIGGDGTLRAVVDRLISAREVCPLPPLLVVPLGTANLMGKHLGVRWDGDAPEDAVADAIAHRNVVELDAACANDRPFLLMTGVGIDAQIVHALDRLRKGPIDLTSYILPAALAFQEFTFPALAVEVDGRTVFQARPAAAFVGNIPEYGTGFPILPLARSDDGLLDVCVLPCASRGQLLRVFLQAAAGEHALAEGAVYVKGKHITIESAEPVPVQVDGEAAGFTPVRIDLLPFKLPFIVP